MPKKNKKPRKSPSHPRRHGARTGVAPPEGWTPQALSGVVHTAASRGFGLGTASDEDWDRLRAQFLERHPACPDCGAAWDMAAANEEEGETFDGSHVISISAWCTTYDADEVAGREPAPHPVSDGMREHTLTLD
jgi:hypothetical protein